MSKRDQMLHGLMYAVVIVDLQQTDAGAIRPYIDEDQRDLAFGELIEQRLFGAEGHHCYAFYLALEHTADAVRHAPGVIVGRADEDLVAVLYGDVFEALN